MAYDYFFHADLETVKAELRHRTLCALVSILSSRVLQEIEHSRVHDSMLGGAHGVTGVWHQFAPDIRKEPTRPSQCLAPTLPTLRRWMPRRCESLLIATRTRSLRQNGRPEAGHEVQVGPLRATPT